MIYKKSIILCKIVEQESRWTVETLESKVADWVLLVVSFSLLQEFVWIYLRLGDFKGELRDRVSVDSSEENVSSLYCALTPILEKEYISDNTSSMSLDARNVDLPEFSMAFNMRLTYIKTNNHGSQLFQDQEWVLISFHVSLIRQTF